MSKEEQDDNTQGMYYVKVPKTSSSSLARITKRIAGREAHRQKFKNNVNDDITCKICSDPFQHNYASALNIHKRNKIKSLL